MEDVCSWLARGVSIGSNRFFVFPFSSASFHSRHPFLARDTLAHVSQDDTTKGERPCGLFYRRPHHRVLSTASCGLVSPILLNRKAILVWGIDLPGGSQTSVSSSPEGSTIRTSIVRMMTHADEEHTCCPRYLEASCFDRWIRGRDSSNS